MFKNIFKRKYLLEQYYKEKAKEFYELRLGAMTMKELCSNFLSLLRCLPYIIDEKTKIQSFLSCFPIMFKERIEYGDLKMLEEVRRKEFFCYDQNKNKRESVPTWKTKKRDKFDPINSIKAYGIIIKGIRAVTIKTLNHIILQ